MTAFIGAFRGEFGVEPICRALPIAPSTYHQRKAAEQDTSRAFDRARRDEGLREKIRKLWSDNRGLYGARKVWLTLRRHGVVVARCTVEWLMRERGLQGAAPGRKVVTTAPDAGRPCLNDKINRVFHAKRPNRLWVSAFTYVATWSGTIYVVFAIDVFARVRRGLEPVTAHASPLAGGCRPR